MDQFSNIDIFTIIVYLALIMGVSLYAARRKGDSTSGYFLAGKNLGWFAIGASLFVTNISAEHFIGLSESGAVNGLVVGHFEWMAVFAILLLGWLFGPLYLKAGVYTVPEYLEQRYNRASRLYLTSISVVAYILTKISVTLFAGGLLLNALLGWDIYTSAVIMVVITGIYTVIGGLSAVVYTQVIQLFFLVAGSAVITFVGLHEVGGFSGLLNSLPESYFNIFRPMADPDFPWTGVMLGAPILAIWYWCTDQYIVQRVLGARDHIQLKKAALFTSILKLLPVFLLVVPGMIAAVLLPRSDGGDVFLVMLARQFLPDGLTGLFLAGLLAAIMSSLASVFNSTATLFTMDFYRIFNPRASDRKLVLIGRLSTTLIVITAILWIPVTKLINAQIYLYLQSVQAYISPPIAVVFIFGLISKRVNGRGAIWSLVAGGIIGLLRLVLQLIHDAFVLNWAPLRWFVEINFLHFAVLLFLLSAVVLFTVSLLQQEREQPVRAETGTVAGGRFLLRSITRKKIKQHI